MSHDHSPRRGADLRWLRTAFALIVTFLVVEVVVAFASGSLALLADAGHMLTDAAAIGLSVWALRLSARPAAGSWTWGWRRAEILSAAANGITLLVVAALVTYEAIRRLIDPPPVVGLPLVVVASVGVVVNVLAAASLHRADRSSLNVEGAFQHVLTDIWAFLATVAAGAVVLSTGWRRADPLASLVVVTLMLRSAWGLLHSAGRILLEAAPVQVDLDELRGHLLGAPHVIDVHDLHVWSVTDDLPALSAHIVVESGCFNDGHAPQILDELQAVLSGSWSLEHSTLQLEPAGHEGHEGPVHA